MSKIQLRAAWVLGVALLATVATGVWWARPGTAAVRVDKPITIVVTFPPGGGTDLLARRLGAALQERVGQPVLVENRPGASGNIGARAVAEAAGDGSTLLMVNSSFAINPGVYRHLGFDPRKDFKAVFNAGRIASVLVVPEASAVHSLSDALAIAAAQPPLAFATCGNGTPQHMAGEMIALTAQRKLQHVPYKGCGPAVMAVAAGQVPLAVVTVSSAAPLMAAGRVRAIAITSAARAAQFPDIPTVTEQGLPGFAVEQWHGLLAPAATPDERVGHLYAAFAEVAAQPEMQKFLREQGYTQVVEKPQAFAKVIAADLDRYALLAKRLGLQVD